MAPSCTSRDARRPVKQLIVLYETQRVTNVSNRDENHKQSVTTWFQVPGEVGSCAMRSIGSLADDKHFCPSHSRSTITGRAGMIKTNNGYPLETCDGCAEMLKKNQVDAHAKRCRRCEAVSCVDCSVSFYGAWESFYPRNPNSGCLTHVVLLGLADDYRAHTSCMTEAERYEGKLAKPKKRNPQQEWMDIVESSAESAPMHLKGYLETMAGLDNIPRKEKQFRNFTGNSLGLRGRNETVVGEIWSLLKKERDRRQAEKEKERQRLQDVQTQKKEVENKEGVEEIDDHKVQESSAKDPVEANASNDVIDRKKVAKAMKKALKKAPNRSMKVKALRKQLGDQLGLSKKEKKTLKGLLLQVPKESKKSKMVVDGKTISLI
eukprot:scaffold9191_cov114-Cylindrotheca_fusiformis.AAC.7